MSMWRAYQALVVFSASRLFWSSQSAMLLVPIIGCGLFIIARDYTGFSEEHFRAFSGEFALTLFVTMLLPLITLAYATSSLGREREDRTLTFLLLRPLPRALLFLAKFVATLGVGCFVSAACFGVYCLLAGSVGQLGFRLYMLPILEAAAAYTSLFFLFSIWFRHATIVALVYAFLLEFVVGNLPGMIKQVAVHFYARSMMLAAGQPHGLSLPPEELFNPIPAESARMWLWGIFAATLCLGLLSFLYKEYRDLG